MTTLVLLLAITTLLTLGGASGAELMAFGDSWGTTGAAELRNLGQRKGFTVDDQSIPGTTAAFWARRADALKEKVDDAPDTRVIWFTLGGNDFITKRQTMTPLPVEEIISSAFNDTQTVLDPLFEAYPDMIVVGFGYEIFSWGTAEEEGRACNQIAEGLFFPDCEDADGGLDKTCANELWLGLHGLHGLLADQYPENYKRAEIIGALQSASGVPGAEIGQPVTSEFSDPMYFAGGGCIHANDLGYEVIFSALYDTVLNEYLPVK